MGNLKAAIDQITWLCEHGNVGYDQSQRWTFNPASGGGECDCSSLVIGVLDWAGFDTGDATYTGNMRSNLTAHGWVAIYPDLSQARPGDILLNEAYHVCMVVSGYGYSAMIAQASIDENGRASGGQAGDQTGNETNVRPIYTYAHGGWDCILRYAGEQVQPDPDPAPVVVTPDPEPASYGLETDGYWGSDTTRALQDYYNTPVDGIVSDQYAPNRQPGLTSGWEWHNSVSGGSTLIRTMQHDLGVTVDGIGGPETWSAIQGRAGTPVDGQLWEKSPAIAEMQRRLNNRTW